ncbi:MAG TPA: hypothetical protein VJR89_12180 [Polyangiales bacterium]|nr:hypothetical protein [Polyangiales bacterium]
MEREELETIADETLNEVSGGCFGIGWITGAVIGGFLAGAGLLKPGASGGAATATPPSDGQAPSAAWHMT